MNRTSSDVLRKRAASATGNVTLRLSNGADLTGAVTVTDDNGTVTITLTAGATVWTVPLDTVLAVGGAA